MIPYSYTTSDGSFSRSSTDSTADTVLFVAANVVFFAVAVSFPVIAACVVLHKLRPSGCSGSDG